MKLLNPNESTKKEQMPAGYSEPRAPFIIMQSLELFILELRSARNRLLQVFELPRDYRPHLKRDRIDSDCEETLSLSTFSAVRSAV
jgi:hypothetical protein